MRWTRVTQLVRNTPNRLTRLSLFRVTLCRLKHARLGMRSTRSVGRTRSTSTATRSRASLSSSNLRRFETPDFRRRAQHLVCRHRFSSVIRPCLVLSTRANTIRHRSRTSTGSRTRRRTFLTSTIRDSPFSRRMPERPGTRAGGAPHTDGRTRLTIEGSPFPVRASNGNRPPPPTIRPSTVITLRDPTRRCDCHRQPGRPTFTVREVRRRA